MATINTTDDYTGWPAMGSAASNRVAIALGVNAPTDNQLWFGVERTKNSAGEDTGEGVLLLYHTGKSGWLSHSLLWRFNQPQPKARFGGPYLDAYGLAAFDRLQSPGNSNGPQSNFSGQRRRVYPIIPFSYGEPYPPGDNFMFVNKMDFANGALFSVSRGATQRQYYCFGSGMGFKNVTSGSSNLAMRFE
jgi:hypothetical protein